MIDFKQAVIGGAAFLLSGCGELLQDVEDGQKAQNEQVLKQADEAIIGALLAETKDYNMTVFPVGKSVSGNFNKAKMQFTATKSYLVDNERCASFDVIVARPQGRGKTDYYSQQDRPICLPLKGNAIR